MVGDRGSDLRTRVSPADLPDRWAAAIDVAEDGCWLWTQSTKPSGYGQAYDGTTVYAHRAVYELLLGPIRAGKHLHHLCGVRRCVNPEHLDPMDPIEHQHLHFIRGDMCSAGHRWGPDTTYIRRDGGRQCRRCKADRRNRWYHQHAAEDIARRTADRQRQAAP